jgi:ribosomal protein S18 acetylase RimI-like enzyme
MAISTAVSRFADYYRRHGFGATFRRAGSAVHRTLFSYRSVLFYFDLASPAAPLPNLPSSVKVERKKCAAELSAADLQEITCFWNPKLVRRNINERFDLGASLWLIKSHDKLAGYGWTLKGRTIEPHFFSIGREDVHLFHFHVFPPFRGQGMNPFLVTYILGSLASEGAGRAFIEAAEWNQPQLSSLAKTPFLPLGMATKWTIFGHNFVVWGKTEAEANP